MVQRRWKWPEVVDFNQDRLDAINKELHWDEGVNLSTIKKGISWFDFEKTEVENLIKLWFISPSLVEKINKLQEKIESNFKA